MAAQVASSIMAEVSTPVSLIDVGSGQGIWAQTFQEKIPSIKTVTAIDLDAQNIIFLQRNRESEISKISRNLANEPILPEQTYDLGICVEVLEHLPKKASEGLILEFGKKCRLMIFSAAITGQGGTQHINEQSLEYWNRQMAGAGFVPFDIFRDSFTSNVEIPKYYSNSIALWVNKNLITQEIICYEKFLPYIPSYITDVRTFASKFRFLLLSLFPVSIVSTMAQIKNLINYRSRSL
jgi:hypothetical protein